MCQVLGVSSGRLESSSSPLPATPTTSPRAVASAPPYIARQLTGAAPEERGDLTAASRLKVTPPVRERDGEG